MNTTPAGPSPWERDAREIERAQAAHRATVRHLRAYPRRRCPFCDGVAIPDAFRPGVIICINCAEPVAFEAAN